MRSRFVTVDRLRGASLVPGTLRELRGLHQSRLALYRTVLGWPFLVLVAVVQAMGTFATIAALLSWPVIALLYISCAGRRARIAASRCFPEVYGALRSMTVVSTPASRSTSVTSPADRCSRGGDEHLPVARVRYLSREAPAR